MRKSLVVKLVLLNSALALSGCARSCQDDDKKDKDKPGASCRGSRVHVFWHGGGAGWRRGTGVRSPAPGTGTVGRGGFGSTGHGVAS
jgi:hypothetical protein